MTNNLKFPEIAADQLHRIEARHIGCFVKQDGSKVYQALENKDPDDCRLESFRANELENVRKFTREKAFVVLVGPPGCGKSHILGEIEKDDPSVLRYSIVCSPVRYEEWFVEEELERFKIALQGKSERFVIIDEFSIDPTSFGLFEQAKLEGRQVLAAVGGPYSNQEKIRCVSRRYSNDDPTFVEMSFKPLNTLQLDEFAAKQIRDRRIPHSERDIAKVNSSFEHIRIFARTSPVDPGLIRTLNLQTGDIRHPNFTKWKLDTLASGEPIDQWSYITRVNL